MYTKQWRTRLAAGLAFMLCMALGFSMAGAPKASAMNSDDAFKYALQYSEDGELNTKGDSKVYLLPEGENGWGWDPKTATLTFRNYDDRARSESKVYDPKFLDGFQVLNEGEKEAITVKFEGTNYLLANAGGDGIQGMRFFPEGKEVRFVGDPDAVLNIDTYALYEGDGKTRLDQSGIILYSKASGVTFKSGTVNITGHYTQEDIANKRSRNPVFIGIDTDDIDSGTSKVSVTGNANLNIKVDTQNTTVGKAKAMYAKTLEVTTTGQVHLEGYNQTGRLSSSTGKAETDAIFDGAGKVTYKWTNGDGKTTNVFPFKTNTTQDNIDNHEYVGYLNPVAGGSLEQGYLQGNDGEKYQVPTGKSVSAEIGRVYAVSTALQANDSGVTKTPTAMYFDGSKAYPLKKPFGVGETLPEVQAIGAGNTVQMTAAPAPAGYALGWSVKKNGEAIPEAELAAFYESIGISAEDLTNPSFNYTQPANNLEWTATYSKVQTHSVTFDMGGHGEQILAQKVVSGKKAMKPAAPTAKGWVFKGWYQDKELKTPFEFNAAITADTTVYAKWEKAAAPNVQHPTQAMAKSGVGSLETAAALAALVALVLGIATVAISRRRG